MNSYSDSSPHGGRRTRAPVGHDAEEHVLDKINRKVCFVVVSKKIMFNLKNL